MTDNMEIDSTETFFSATDQLQLIYQWARARYAAPWAVFFAVLLRVSASTGPHVQLPGVIGGRASLNLMCAFVAPSGGGKGISDKVARLAWPTEILELPIGSGEGIDETFTLRGKESQDNERVTNAIFNCPEIDILTGLESRQGSTILGKLKAFAMGEQLGSTNASKANSRNVPAHSYRGCVSVSAQPGHTGVIFSDTSGGTPQRFLWALTIDPGMPGETVADPEPLNHHLPGLLTRRHDDPNIVTEIVYGPAEIRQSIIAAHLARQRGEGDALDGHWMLTRAKVAAVLAVMHHRTVVSELDWQLSQTVMAVSDRTRDWILTEAKKAERAKVRDRAQARASGEEFYDSSRLETVKRSLLRMLERDGEQAGNVLRSRLGRREKRDLFDQAIALLEADGLVSQAPGRDKGIRYRIGGQGDQGGQGAYAQVKHPDHVGQGDHPATVTDLDSRRSHDTERPKLTAREWFDQHIAELQTAGHKTARSFAVLQAGEAAGFTKNNLRQAASAHPDVHTIDRKGGTATWSIEPGTKPARYQSAASWLDDYIDQHSSSTLDPGAVQVAAEAAGQPWHAVQRAASLSPRITSEHAHNGVKNARIWKVAAADDEGVGA